MGVHRLYKAAAPYYASELSETDFVQSTNEIYFANLNSTPQKLTRTDHTDWAFSELTFGPVIAAPGSVAAAASQPNATGAIATTYTYYVTATDANGQESRASSPDTETNDLSLAGNYNTITWAAVADAAFYTVYKGDNGSPGYIGMVEAGTLTFKDRNLTAVLSDTPPRGTNPFIGTGNYPSTVGFHQERLLLGRTINRPNAIWGSQSADPENLDASRPVKPDDSLSFALLTEKVNSVNQLVSMKEGLIVLGSDSIFNVTGGEGGALTPAAIKPDRQSGRGASRLNPLVVDSVIFYRPLRSSSPRALGFTFEVDGYRSNNVGIFSPHLFKGKVIVDWAYQEEPFSCIWAAMSDGGLLCFTWEEEQQVWGWTPMEIDGFVERVAVINEGGYSRLYALIRRTIAGAERRFHERLALPHIDDITTACHLDCSVVQISETPSDVIDQLWHLEGETVSATYDGYVVHGLLVENGRVQLPHEANIRAAGLRYEGLIETLPFILGGQGGSLHTERQTIGDVVIRALETRGLELSADGETFDPLPDRQGVEVAQLPTPVQQDLPLPTQGNWSDGSTLTIRQAEPLPAHLLAIFAEVIVSPKDE